MQKLESREVGAHKGTAPTRKTNPREKQRGRPRAHLGQEPRPPSPPLCPQHREPPPHPNQPHIHC